MYIYIYIHIESYRYVYCIHHIGIGKHRFPNCSNNGQWCLMFHTQWLCAWSLFNRLDAAATWIRNIGHPLECPRVGTFFFMRQRLWVYLQPSIAHICSTNQCWKSVNPNLKCEFEYICLKYIHTKVIMCIIYNDQTKCLLRLCCFKLLIYGTSVPQKHLQSEHFISYSYMAMAQNNRSPILIIIHWHGRPPNWIIVAGHLVPEVWTVVTQRRETLELSLTGNHMVMGQNITVPLVNIKIAGIYGCE